MWQLARQPRWIAMLVLALAIAGAFAALVQWQLSRSVESSPNDGRATEVAQKLVDVAVPNSPVTTVAAGQIVETTGSLVPGDWVVLSGRTNQGESGYWVVGHLLVDNAEFAGTADVTDASLAVAVGWSATEEGATSAVEELDDQVAASGPVDIVGRYLPTEAPTEDDYEDGEQNSASVAALVNQWDELPGPVFGGYLVLNDAPAGLDDIDSPVPSGEVTLNWLNIFYAIEWVVFAGFAVFLWFRLVRDAWERQEEDREEAEAAAEADRATHVN